MLDELGVARPPMSRALAGLQDIPTDIEPIFATAEELAPTAKEEPAMPAKKKKNR
jgi:hypothetical protein